MKDEYNALNIERQPGPLVDLLGGRAEQFYAIDKEVPVSGDLGSGTANVWVETLSTKSADTQVLMKYGASNGWLDNQPAVITRKVGKGSITYIGAWLDDGLLAKLTASQLEKSGVQPILPNTPDGVEVCLRTGASKSVLIVINHKKTEAHVDLPHTMRDLIGSGESSLSVIDLPGYGVAVLEGK
jgi:beta-galactosidase